MSRKVTIAAIALVAAALVACVYAGTPHTPTMRAGNIRW